MLRLSVFMLSVLLPCASAALADEEIIQLLARRSEEYMEHLDRKEFLAIRNMLDPEIIQMVPEDKFLKTIVAVYGEMTIFYGKPRVSIMSSASAVVSVKVIYFSQLDISVECLQIYWVQRRGQWFITHHMGLLDMLGCIS